MHGVNSLPELMDLPSGDGAAPLVVLYYADISKFFVDESASSEWLTQEEQARVARLRRESDRRRFVAGRLLLRTVLGQHLGCVPRDVDLCFSERGKPYLESGPSFNLSHSGDSVLLGVCEYGALGVDVESIAERNYQDAIAQRVFSLPELAQYAGMPSEQRCSAFFRGWARKEAFAKALGVGITVNLKEFDVTLDETSGNALLEVRWLSANPRSWCVRSVPLLDGAEIAVALDASDFDVSVADATDLLTQSQVLIS